MASPIFHVFEGLPRSVSPSSHAVEAGGWVFLTGQFPRDLDDPLRPLPAGIEAQTERTLANMARVLEGLGLTLGSLVGVRVCLAHFESDYAAMNAVYARHFPEARRPARTCIGVARLVCGARIEIDGIARR